MTAIFVSVPLPSSSVCDTQRRLTIAVLPTTCTVISGNSSDLTVAFPMRRISTPLGSGATVWRACGLPRHDCQAAAVIARNLETKQFRLVRHSGRTTLLPFAHNDRVGPPSLG